MDVLSSNHYEHPIQPFWHEPLGRPQRLITADHRPVAVRWGAALVAAAGTVVVQYSCAVAPLLIHLTMSFFLLPGNGQRMARV